MSAAPAARNAKLQWGHGREAMDGLHNAENAAHTADSFNGAMAVRPWMVSRSRYSLTNWCRLQWGHGREAMDGGRAVASIVYSSGFNGAMAVRPWMADRVARTAGMVHASMGPWP